MQVEVNRANSHNTRIVETPADSSPTELRPGQIRLSVERYQRWGSGPSDGLAEPNRGYVAAMHEDTLS